MSLLESIDQVRFSPADMQRIMLDRLDEQYKGEIDIKDASNPFVFLLEASSATGAASMLNSELVARKLYPPLAQTQEEIYRHMSDRDYIDRFALPSNATVTVMLSLDEVIKHAVNDTTANQRKLTIPRDTIFTIAGYSWGIYYPIELRVMPHGGVQVVYNGNIAHPLHDLTDDLLDSSVVSLDNVDYLRFDVPVNQFSVRSHYFPVNVSTGISELLPLTDSFYYARVFTGDTRGNWSELLTTHSDQVFDPTIPTAVLTVLEDSVRVTIPQIYFTRNLLQSQIRVDLYTTKGPLSLILNDYPSSEYGVTWENRGDDNNDKYTAPLPALTTLALYGVGVSIGGRLALSLDELRERVITNSNYQAIPITETHLRNLLSDRGYTVTLTRDDVTDRVYHISRLMPSPEVGDLSATVGTLTSSISFTEAVLQNLATVNKAQDRYVILPSTLYTYDQGLLTVVQDDQRESIEFMTPARVSQELNNTLYLYTPFHYVLDVTRERFDVTPYYLDAPVVVGKKHVYENTNIPLQANSSSVEVKRTENGYTILIVMNPTTIDLAQLHVQLAFKPHQERAQAFLNGVLLGLTGDSPVYEFVIDTDYALEGTLLPVSNFKMHQGDLLPHNLDLTAEFSVYYSISEYPADPSAHSEIDSRMGVALLPLGAIGLMEESVVITLGKQLVGLKADSRSVIGSLPMATYAEDIPWTYTENIYARDVDGHILFDTTSGNVEYTILHAAGDPVLDETTGEPLIRYAKDSIMVDSSGNPIVEDSRKIDRQLDLTLFDAKYRFATDPNMVKYREALPTMITQYLETDIVEINGLLLERTDVKFAPKRTLGNIDVTVRDGSVISIDSAQSFIVDYYLTEVGYADTSLRSAITDSTNAVIAKALTSSTVATATINEALKTMGGSEVISVSVRGLGGTDLAIYTLKDDTATSTIATQMEVLADGVLRIIDDVSINFINHVR